MSGKCSLKSHSCERPKFKATYKLTILLWTFYEQPYVALKGNYSNFKTAKNAS